MPLSVTGNPMSKVYFKLDSGDWHGHASESLWGEQVSEGIYKLRNSPFFARGISNNDCVSTIYDEERKSINFLDAVYRGGHSTYMILTPVNQLEIIPFWSELADEGCTFESAHIKLSIGRRNLYSVDVPPGANLARVSGSLIKGEEKKEWIFQEGYISKDDSLGLH